MFALNSEGCIFLLVKMPVNWTETMIFANVNCNACLLDPGSCFHIFKKFETL